MKRTDLTNRVAVVTGGAQGIGRAIAERLLAEGASVVIWDRDEAALGVLDVKDAGGQVLDVTDYEAVDAAVGRVMAESTSWSTTPGSAARPFGSRITTSRPGSVLSRSI